MIAVDTSVWIDFFAGRATWQVEHLTNCLDGRDEVALTDIVLTEILQGLRTDNDVQRVDDYLSVFEVLRLRDLADFRFAAALYRFGAQTGRHHSAYQRLSHRGRLYPSTDSPTSRRRGLRPAGLGY